MVLHIVNQWSKGGVERFIEGLAESSKGGEIRHSVLSMCTEVNSSAPFLSTYGPLSTGSGIISLCKASIKLCRFLEKHHFDVIHVHSSNSSGYLYCAIAKFYNIPIRIIHSHNSSMQVDSGFIKVLFHYLLRIIFSGCETIRLACSASAAHHLFADNSYEFIPNGIDVTRFQFNCELRSSMRIQLGLNDTTRVVLCIGSLINAKNHKRALLIFHKLLESSPSSFLVILGDGPLRAEILALIESLELGDKVILPGFVEDAQAWFSLADVVLFPSLYEGFPISLVEAQCNGLPIICSDSVTNEVSLVGNLTFLSLGEKDQVWADSVLKATRCDPDYAVNTISKLGFSRQSTVGKLNKIYVGESKYVS